MGIRCQNDVVSTFDVDATWSRRINVNMTSFLRHVPAGLIMPTTAILVVVKYCIIFPIIILRRFQVFIASYLLLNHFVFLDYADNPLTPPPPTPHTCSVWNLFRICWEAKRCSCFKVWTTTDDGAFPSSIRSGYSFNGKKRCRVYSLRYIHIP